MKALHYEIIKHREGDNIATKLSRRAELSVTIIRADTFLPSISNSCFFTVDYFLTSMYGWMIAKIIILLFYPGKQFLLRTEPHARAEQKICYPH